jgi:hypothetical protein
MEPVQMSDLYDTDIVAWSEQQAALLRRLAEGERVKSNQIDWPNIAEEIEDVGISEVNAALSQIDNILRHRLYLLGWPDHPSIRRWPTHPLSAACPWTLDELLGEAT